MHFIFANIEKFIDGERRFFMGIAMLSVVLFHLGVVWNHPITLPFHRGYIGVDVFLFFSGYGLCYSWNKSSLGEYYTKRIIRIMPLFLVLAATITFFAYYQQDRFGGAWNWFCSLTTLSFYGLGGVKIDWYLSSLMLLYLISPLIIKLSRKFTFLLWAFAVLVCGVILQIFNFVLFYRCIIGRLPIFVLGIAMWKSRGVLFANIWRLVFLISTIAWGVSLMIHADCFIRVTLFTPALISLIAIIIQALPTDKMIKTEKIINVLGEKSLEIYVGNVLAMYAVKKIPIDGFVVVLSYFGFTFLFSIIACYYNDFVQKRLKKIIIKYA